ncbi:relaxase/mobilization nuclease domain-containing protein [Falsigemmobacter intermedius]|uniref:relaxase/mobilization nuclease domain-containing protein n=2 Tax=Falsigemmobacter intermedius TaxID=1553448 RepID=UPI0035EC5B60
MRPHCKRHSDPDVLMNYTMREGAELLGGTLPVLVPQLLQERLKALAGPKDGLLHVILSLPKGLQASKELWLKIVARAMKGLGIDSETTPWFSVRHSDKDCDHVHTGIALRDFAGRRLEARTSEAACTAVHRDLCTHLCLPEPPYDDGRLTLSPQVPARRIRSEPRNRLKDELTEAFVKHQPENMEALNAVMETFKAKAVVNGHGVSSWQWSDGTSTLWGGRLGKAWQPAALKLRFAFAASLRRMRNHIENALIERALQHPKLMEILHDFDNASGSPAAARTAGGAAEQDGTGGSECAAPAPAPGPAQHAGGREGKPRGSLGEYPSGRERRAGAQFYGNGGVEGGRAVADLGSGAGGSGDHQPHASDGAAGGADLQGAEREAGLTFGAWVARCSALAASLGGAWKIRAKANPPQIFMRFEDHSSVFIRPDNLRIGKAGKTAEAFMKIYFPSNEEPEIPKEDDDLPSPW